MIIKRCWTKRKWGKKRDYCGWYLFGIFPLYVKKSYWY